METLPHPPILTLDPNDENIILGIPNDVDSAKQRLEPPTPAPKVKIPHPHVKKSKILLGKAGVINVLEEDSPPPPPKSPHTDPFNVSNDRFVFLLIVLYYLEYSFYNIFHNNIFLELMKINYFSLFTAIICRNRAILF